MMTIGTGREWAALAGDRVQLWRILLGLAVIAVVYIVLNLAAFGAVALFESLAVARQTVVAMANGATPRDAFLLFATFIPLALAAPVAARLLHKRRAGTLFGAKRQVAVDFATSAGIGLGVYGGYTALMLVLSPDSSLPNLPLWFWLALLPLTMIAIAVQTLSEELVFRAYLQQQLAARFGWRVIWMGLPALLFGGLHYNPASYGSAALYAVAAATLFGLLAADLTARTRSIGAAWGLHFANNLLGIAILAIQGTITGLALRVTSFQAHEITRVPVAAALDLLPMLLVWLLLRRILTR